MTNRHRPNINHRNAKSVSAPQNKQINEDDMAFFERNPTRSHRIRPTTFAEQDVAETLGDKFEVPPDGMHWVTVIRKIDRSALFKSVCLAPKGFGANTGEALSRAVFVELTSPEKIVLCDKFAFIRRYDGEQSENNRGDD